MSIALETTDSAVSRGIKTAGIGKKGSRSLDPELIADIILELHDKNVNEAAKGALFGALVLKGITEDERALETAIHPATFSDLRQFVEVLMPQVPQFVKSYCIRLLNQETLNTHDTEELGHFLFSNAIGDVARGMIASIMRVRYETPDEYEGLLKSIAKTFEPPFQKPPPKGEPIIQIAEPFDGVDHSNLITPLIADYLQSQGYRSVSLVGRNSGPKFGNNLLELAQALNGKIITSNAQVSNKKPDYGYYLNQENLSKAMDRWVDIRRSIIKRPFMATIERFVNPLNADIMLASAFHPPYGEKMLTICERAGFSKSIIVRNGLEGTLSFPLKRDVRILVSAKQKDGSFKRNEIIFSPEKQLGIKLDVEEKLDVPSLAKNRELIEEFKKKGRTSYNLFNYRIKATRMGIKQALDWMDQA